VHGKTNILITAIDICLMARLEALEQKIVLIGASNLTQCAKHLEQSKGIKVLLP
jgi:hypothetical protein